MFCLPANGLSCPQILEPASLLYIASALNLATAQDPLGLCVFNKKQLHLVKVSVGGSPSLKVDYIGKLGDSQIRVDKKIYIFIDKTSRIPVQGSGKLPPLGK
jgi:hypothetical protein